MAAARRTGLVLAALCLAQLAVIAQATRPGPMLRGGTVLLLSRPHSVGSFMAPRLSAESSAELGAFDRFNEDTMDRLVAGPSVFQPRLLIFGRPNRAFTPFGLPRRPCPFGRDGSHNPDAMLKHMAAARFGPDLLSSLLASAEGEEQEALDTPVYTINPAAVARASVQPRRLGGADFDKEGPFRGHKSSHPLEAAASAGAAAAASQASEQQPQRYVTTLSSGFGIPEAAAARLTPSVIACVQDRHGVQLSIDRVQLGASRSFPMVTISSNNSDALEAASAEFHSIINTLVQSAQQTTLDGSPRWSFRDFVSRVGPSADGHPGAAALPLPDARQRAAFEGRLFGDATGAMRLLPPRRRPQPPSLTWDLFQDDGQLNNGALVFLLLCVACAVVWSRLAVLWCAFRHGGRRGRRCRWRRLRSRCRGVGDAGPDSLQAPLLNPLQHEAPPPNTQQFKVEVAAKHTPAAPFNNYVTLEYVPLRSEQ